MKIKYPLVSVIIPTYNRASMVGNAIQSVISQNYPNKEILVIDDGSIDDTASVVQKFDNVRYILQEHKGQASARNNGWKHAGGKYIASLDSDDVWEFDFLQKCIHMLEQFELDFVFANWNQESVDGQVKNCFSTYPLVEPFLHLAVDSWVSLDHAQVRSMYIKGCPSPSSSLVIRASSLTLGWNENINIGDDWGMLLDMIFSKNIKAAFTTECLWFKKVNCNNIYDGRCQVEVNKLLWIADSSTIFSRYVELLTKSEKKFLEKRFLESLILSAKHNLLHYSDYGESLRNTKQALLINPIYTTRLFSQKFLRILARGLGLF